MTWNERRKDWMGRAPTPRATRGKAVSSDTPLVVPSIPVFSPACIAFLLNTTRQNVHYWMSQGNLVFYRDPIGEPYVLRDELLVFIEHYLQRSAQS